MSSPKDAKSIARYLYCSSILEGRVANAYKHLSDRIEDQQVKSLVQYILHDTTKHSTILRNMADNIAKQEVKIEDCEQIWGKGWKNWITTSIEELSKREKVTTEELATLVDGMAKLENYFAEGYLTITNIEIVRLLARQRNLNLGNFNTILEWTIQDEKRHQTTMMMIKELISKQNQSQKQPQQTNT
jgi:ribonucleotide reductase beta subunit family protein with ferritin-like domain